MRTPPRRFAAILSLALLATPATALLVTAPAGAAATDIRINELQSQDPAGGSDWVELVNRGSTPFDVGGLVLKDSTEGNNLTLPSTTIAAGGFTSFDVSGLGGGDTVRLTTGGGQVLDSFAYPDHAPYTWGRCPDGVGTFTVTLAATRDGANSCAPTTTASTWPGGSTVREADTAGQLGDDVSGLTYDPSGTAAPGTLWAVSNGAGTLYRLTSDGSTWTPSSGYAAPGKQLRYPGGTGTPDAEGITTTSAGSAGGLYVAAERNGTANTVSRNSVLRYVPTGAAGGLDATTEWDLTALLPPSKPNYGIEGIAWVPDSYLVANGLKDAATGTAYTPATYPGHGSGLFLVGMESGGGVFAFALGSGGSATLVSQVASGFPSVADLQFETESQQLWVGCDNTCDGKIGRFTVANGVLAPTGGYVARPSGMDNLNNEGFLVTPRSECVGGVKPVLWADDGNTAGHVLRQGTTTCTVVPPAPPADATAPVVSVAGVTNGATYLGVAPAATCAATDAGSGLATCTLATTTSGKRTTITATATDKAGNRATAAVSFTVLTTFVKGAAYKNGAFAVKRGRTFTVVTYLASGRPTLTGVVAKGRKPGGKGPKVKAAGTAGTLTIWQAKVKAPRSLAGKTWLIGVQVGGKTIKLKLTPTGK